LLRDLHIDHLKGSRADRLSGGERRRLEISRALVTQPSFILLDEPFAGIDPIAVVEIQGLIRSLRDRGIGVLISDHNVRETLRVCDRAYIMHEGRILEQGSPQGIAQSELARRTYLGQEFSL
jgi:lipopolysaccharide export system ATP-binding protein